ncbi:MAG: hypothetical protein GY856_01935 [bacterium]|nr:hypothetical protein [bacterium]
MGFSQRAGSLHELPANSAQLLEFPQSRAFRRGGPLGLGRYHEPLLIYPIGHLDDDPEQLMTFTGLVAGPSENATPLGRKRATATIELFRLNHRTEVTNARSSTMSLVWKYFKRELDAPNGAGREAARRTTDSLVSSNRLPQAACARAFLKFARADPATARRLLEHAETVYHQYLGRPT